VACVSGVTGADLKKRIVRIMTDFMPNRLSFGRKVLLIVFGLAAIAGPVFFGLLNAPQIRAQSPPTTGQPLPSFEVASIKPNRSPDGVMQGLYPPGRVSFRYTTMKRLIAFAYHVRPFQVTGEPSWINSDKWDIDAKEPDALAEQRRNLSVIQQRQKVGLLVQALLTDRCRLKVTHEVRELPIYALVVAKRGPKLRAAKPGDTYPNGLKGDNGQPIGHGDDFHFGRGSLIAQGIPLQAWVDVLSFQLGRTILDQTGLKGKYDFNLHWTPDENADVPAGPGGDPNGAGGPAPDILGPSIFTAIQEQLGLRLESTKGPVEVVMIDHIERPSEN
jgi:bla regulator protein blaR1